MPAWISQSLRGRFQIRTSSIAPSKFRPAKAEAPILKGIVAGTIEPGADKDLIKVPSTYTFTVVPSKVPAT